MVSRQEMRRKRKRSKVFKLLAGTLLLFVIIGSSIQVSFADQDINGMLTGWFNKKTEDSIEEIDKAISIEQKEQTGRLKEALRLEIESAEKQLQTIVEEEKSKRIAELKQHADELIREAEVNNDAVKEKKVEALDQIVEKAKAEMGDVEVRETPAIEKENDDK